MSALDSNSQKLLSAQTDAASYDLVAAALIQGPISDFTPKEVTEIKQAIEQHHKSAASNEVARKRWLLDQIVESLLLEGLDASQLIPFTVFITKAASQL